MTLDARLTIRLTFLCHALATGSMLTRIPDIQAGLGIDAGVLGLCLLGQPVGIIQEIHDPPGKLPGEGEAAGHDGAGQPCVMASGYEPREASQEAESKREKAPDKKPDPDFGVAQDPA